jgi:hypothetical protein
METLGLRICEASFPAQAAWLRIWPRNFLLGLVLGLVLDVRGEVAAAGSTPGANSSQGGSGRGGGNLNVASSGCISRDSLLGCLQQTLPSLQRLLTMPHELNMYMWNRVPSF